MNDISLLTKIYYGVLSSIVRFELTSIDNNVSNFVDIMSVSSKYRGMTFRKLTQHYLPVMVTDKVQNPHENIAREKILIEPHFNCLMDTIPDKFFPVFENPVWFESQNPLWFIVDTEFVLLKKFSTEKYSRFYFYLDDIVEHSVSFSC